LGGPRYYSVRIEGKDYVMADGEVVVEFRFGNASR
jgi:ribosome-binding ATPase YchF (GTP1/OBG family)